MSGREIESGSALFLPRLKPDEKQRRERAAALRIADQVGAENPHPLDELMPRLAGRQLGQDPVIAAGVRELLDAIGLLEADVAAAKNLNARLKGGQS
ncbi:hypothetical protein AB0I27_23030 [Streptomyces sp. NPDC050597]|uniref:hypothetical protein n=1 Tax=Streptomyces sp. NPDC050597 TaxID=3157212 RepID=UPI003442150D